MLNLIKESIGLDSDTISVENLSRKDKLSLILKKYKYFLDRKFGLNPLNKGNFLGKEFYFPNKFGYVGLQRIIVDASFLDRELPRSLKILDIGAHAGEFSFFASKVLKAKEVVCIEPYSSAFEILEKNNSQNYRYAVTTKKKAFLNISKLSTQLNSLNEDGSRHQYKKEEVPTITLSELIKKLNNEFDVLKIDTEGTEFDVLKSGLKDLHKFKYIIVELETKDDYLKKFKELNSLLSGYKLLALGKYTDGQRSIDILYKKEKKKQKK